MSSHTVPDFDTFFAGQPREHLLAAIDLALLEDGPDLTSDAVFGPVDRLAAEIVAKQQTLVAGLPVAPLVMERCAALLESPVVGGWTWNPHTADGDELSPGAIAADIEGPARLVLKAERVILNFICHMSGIANLTHRYARELEGTATRLLDTRKTLPGLRFPEKYAVLVGGGQNHRRTLAEMLMLKDNHIDAAGSITAAHAGQHGPCAPARVAYTGAPRHRNRGQRRRHLGNAAFTGRGIPPRARLRLRGQAYPLRPGGGLQHAHTQGMT